MTSNEKLLIVSEADYGKQYRDHCLALYQLYVESADKISDRRLNANTFFLTVNTALLGITGYLQSTGVQLLWLVALAGIVISYTWYRLIEAYRSMNAAKFKVIHELEKQLPFALYDAEWEMLEKGRAAGGYTPFSKIEGRVPIVFLVLHVIAGLAIVSSVLAGFSQG